MTPLPVEKPEWLGQHRARIQLEKSCVELMIRWGLSEYSFEVYRRMEERFENLPNGPDPMPDNGGIVWDDSAKSLLRDMFRDYFQKTRDFPRKRQSRQLLQNGLLSGFEGLIGELGQCFEDYRKKTRACQAAPRAA
jgi:hypothetical protein